MMKKSLLAFIHGMLWGMTAMLCASLLFVSGNQVFAAESVQDYVPTPVSISTEKVKIGGKLFYSHIVLEKQTLYSICKAYGVTVEEVYAVNPSLKEDGLKKNAIILIPIKETKGTETKAEAKVESKALESKKSKSKAEPEDENYIIHTAKWYEDLQSISQQYGVSEELIMRVNHLVDKKLNKRQKLRIPVGAAELVVPATDSLSSGLVSETTPIHQIDSSSSTPKLFIPLKRKVEAVLMMPFNASAAKPNEGSMDYYCGFLMALKSLGDDGIDIDLSVYDVADGNLHVTTERLSKSDIVVGPVSSGDLSKLLNVTPRTTAVVSPLDHRAEALTKVWPNLIQAPSSTRAQYKDLVDWIKEEKAPEDSLTVIHEKGYNISGDNSLFAGIVSDSLLNCQTFSYSILEGREITDSLKAMMNPEKCNRVLILSESEAFVNDVVRNLNLMIHEKYNIVLYGASRIRSFETIDPDDLHNVRFHTSVAYHIDYNDPKVKQFIMSYRALYNTEPTPYAYQGYDTALFLLRACSETGGSVLDILTGRSESMLQTDFRFERSSEDSGYVNMAVRRVIYGDNYSVVLAE